MRPSVQDAGRVNKVLLTRAQDVEELHRSVKKELFDVQQAVWDTLSPEP